MLQKKNNLKSDSHLNGEESISVQQADVNDQQSKSNKKILQKNKAVRTS